MTELSIQMKDKIAGTADSRTASIVLLMCHIMLFPYSAIHSQKIKPRKNQQKNIL
jgi:hypothetical protein